MNKNKINSKKIKKEESTTSYQASHEIVKLSFGTVIVNKGQDDYVISLLKKHKVSAFFSKIGEGTASKEVYNLIGLEDNSKSVIFFIFRKDMVDEIKEDLKIYFNASKYNKGVFVSVDLVSIIGVMSYRFLGNC